jgi:hypothetical protein
MKKRIWGCLAVFIIFSFLLSGCGLFYAKKEINNAEKLVSELKAAGGETKTPYEYCSAQTFLEAGRAEYNQGHMGPSKGFIERSKAAAQAGLNEIKKK